MRVLWFSITTSLYNNERNSYNGGGWIESLERIVIENSELNLAIAFTDNTLYFPYRKKELKNVTYYSMGIKRTIFQRLKDKFSFADIDNLTISRCMSVISDYKPDVIHIFGSEWCFGLIKEKTRIPIVIHIQGCWPAYRNAMYPPGYSKLDKYFYNFFNLHKIFQELISDNQSRHRAKREEYILRINDNYMGRTRWDFALTKLFNKNSNYYYCSEALRPNISDNKQMWKLHLDEHLKIITVGGGNVLKGYDLILKTALLLKQNSNLIFKWILCGPTIIDMAEFEKKTGIKCRDVDIFPLGRCSAEQVKEYLLSSQIYVHAAYVDNSPNAVCEAQYLGLPVISTNVGGIPSLFSSEYPSDFLVPTNDPYYLASKIIQLNNDKNLENKLSKLNYSIAHDRHDKVSIYKSLIKCYKSITNSK